MAPKQPVPRGPKEPDTRNIISRYLDKPPHPRTYAGFGYKMQNLVRVHWRGVFGVLVPLCALSWQCERHNNPLKVQIMWLTMAWFFLVRPVSNPVTGLIPIFVLPMTGVMNTLSTCACYMNEHIHLFLVAGALVMLLNNSGTDRRVALAIMTAGGSPRSFSGQMMVYKCATSAFFLSMLSNRLIASSMITEYFTKAMMATETKYVTERNLKEMRYIVNNAIQTSSAIGSTAILHSSFATLAFRAIFVESSTEFSIYADLFNYLQYSAFAFPVALIAFVLNLGYHILLVGKQVGNISPDCAGNVQRMLLNNKAQIPPNISAHEKLAILFLILSHILYFYRWSSWLGGWANFEMSPISTAEFKLPTIQDATIASLFVVILHSLPTSLRFLRIFTATTRADLPPSKPESSILWWRFVDRNLNYSYMFLIGSGVALMRSSRATNLCQIISDHSGTVFTSCGWNGGIFLVILAASLLANVISSTAACVVFLPFVLCMATPTSGIPWPTHGFLGGLAVGISSSFGVFYPFLYTPAYYCYYIGKTPVKKMIVYSVITVAICVLTLYVAMLIYAPYLWNPYDPWVRLVKEPPPPEPGPPPERR